MKVLSYSELKAKGIRWSRSHLRRKVLDGGFPAPLKLGNGDKAYNAWPEREVDAWLEQRAAERSRDGPALPTDGPCEQSA